MDLETTINNVVERWIYSIVVNKKKGKKTQKKNKQNYKEIALESMHPYLRQCIFKNVKKFN